MRCRSGRPSGGTGNSCSPYTRSTARLVTSTVRCGAAPRSSATAGRCRSDVLEVIQHQQQLFGAQMDFEAFDQRLTARLSDTERLATAGMTSAGSLTGASATKRTPSANSPWSSAATCERQTRLADAARHRSA